MNHIPTAPNVTPGLDPGVQKPSYYRGKMDCRIKSGNDVDEVESGSELTNHNQKMPYARPESSSPLSSPGVVRTGADIRNR